MPAALHSWPQSPEKRELFALVGKISLVIFAVEAVIMLALSGWILEAHTIWEGLVDSTTLTIVSSPLIYYWVARPFANSERTARAELADRLRQQAEQADVLNTTLGRLRNLLEQNEELRARLQQSHAIVADINERTLQRIGADLHDGPAQLLSYSLLRLNKFNPLIASYGGERELAELQQMRTALANTLTEIRNLSSGLSLPLLETASLAATIRIAIEKHEEQTGTRVQVEFSGLPECVPQTLKVCVYRFVQEALTNAYRHAGGEGQQVSAWLDERLSISVSDHGPGFEPDDSCHAGIGLTGMRARISELGGELRITSCCETGSCLTAHFDAKLLELNGAADAQKS